MTKKDYMKPAMKACEFDMEGLLLVASVETTGLDDENLDLDGTGDSWNEGMSRRNNDIWDEKEEEL